MKGKLTKNEYLLDIIYDEEDRIRDKMENMLDPKALYFFKKYVVVRDVLQDLISEEYVG